MAGEAVRRFGEDDPEVRPGQPEASVKMAEAAPMAGAAGMGDAWVEAGQHADPSTGALGPDAEQWAAHAARIKHVAMAMKPLVMITPTALPLEGIGPRYEDFGLGAFAN